MGFFDRFSSRKPDRTPETPAAASPASGAAAASAGSPAKPRLTAARERLEAKDLPGAMAIYEEVLSSAGDRADVLVAISGDLGSHGHVSEIVELIAPRYAADRHGPATGLNLLQAYLALRNPDAAQHVLDLLFALNRPELEDRLHGFSNAIAEILASPAAVADEGGSGAGGGVPQVALITLSKPVWFYGLEPLTAQLLPPKEGKLRRIAFAQLALPGYPDAVEAMKRPEDELARLARAVPLWLAETFYFSSVYAPVAAVGVLKSPSGNSQPVIFTAEWSTENLRQLVESASEGVDYIVTGALRGRAGDYELLLRIWEVRTFRERKTLSVRWSPANVDEALSSLHGQVRTFMEWSPASAALAYVVPAQPRAWLETLGASLGLFLADKQILPSDVLPPTERDLAAAGGRAAAGETASLAYLTLRQRAARLGLPLPATAFPLNRSALVQQAERESNA